MTFKRRGKYIRKGEKRQEREREIISVGHERELNEKKRRKRRGGKG